VRCNSAQGNGDDLDMGGAMNSAFNGNAFSSVHLGAHLRSYWVAQGNTWNGAKVVPSTNPTPKLSNC
jgi:hypothetical protein